MPMAACGVTAQAHAHLQTAVPVDGPFGLTVGVLNRIEVDAEPLGRFAVDGPGAGGAATSSAVLGDLIAIARGHGSTWAGLPQATRREGGRSELDSSHHDDIASSGWFAYLPGVPARRVRSGSAFVGQAQTLLCHFQHGRLRRPGCPQEPPSKY
jgi:hypothetical protein